MAKILKQDLLRLLSLSAFLIRGVAARLHLPGKDRFDLLKIANHIDRIVEHAQAERRR